MSSSRLDQARAFWALLTPQYMRARAMPGGMGERRDADRLYGLLYQVSPCRGEKTLAHTCSRRQNSSRDARRRHDVRMSHPFMVAFMVAGWGLGYNCKPPVANPEPSASRIAR